MSQAQPPDPDDKIDYFLEEMGLNYKPETVKGYRTSLNHLRQFLTENGLQPGDLTEKKARRFLDYLTEKTSPTAADEYSDNIKRFYRFYARRGAFETNPMALVLENWDFNKEHREQREISLEDIREICQNERLPRRVFLFTILSKTGIRIGELKKMDLKDIHLDHPGANQVLPEPRYEIEDEPDTLYIPPVLNGEKRKVGTHVPIDEELKQATVYWLASYVHPRYIDESPLMQIRAGGGGTLPGERPVTKKTIRDIVQRTGKKYDQWEEGSSYQQNLTPHKFRHLFSTYAGKEEYGGKMDREVIEYIRGDHGNADTLDQYKHMWGTDVRNEYLNNIFKLYE